MSSKRFSEELKVEAVRLVTGHGHPVAESGGAVRPGLPVHQRRIGALPQGAQPDQQHAPPRQLQWDCACAESSISASSASG